MKTNLVGLLASSIVACSSFPCSTRGHIHHNVSRKTRRQRIEIILSTKPCVYKHAIRRLTQLDTEHANTIFAIAENCKLQNGSDVRCTRGSHE